ncbi:unnamed protein product [Clavelina lepadiformis]|uniref:Cytochrome P450 n=1 Tax=Clavelina lepadiformis TaxID=159417 RepID=A0ABP0EWU6_CLALP
MLASSVYYVLANVYSSINLWTILALLGAALWQWWKKPHPRFPPGPRGVPILGILPFFGKNPSKSTMHWSLRYGSIMSQRMASWDVVYVNNYETYYKCFVKNCNTLNGRPDVKLFSQIHGPNMGLVFKIPSDFCKNQKHLALTSIRRSTAQGQVIHDEFDYFFEHLKMKMGAPVDLKPLIYKFTANVISQIAIGKRFGYKHTKFNDFVSKIEHEFTDPNHAGKVHVCGFFPIMRYIPPFYQANEKFCLGQHHMLAFLRKQVEKSKVNFDPNTVNNFLDVLLHAKTSGDFKGHPEFTDTQIEVFLKEFFSGGMETTSNTLLWCVLALLHLPKYHQLIVEEIDSVIGDQKPKMSHKRNTHVTSAFLQEIWRCMPAVPQTPIHTTLSDLELGGYFLPRGTRVIGNIWAVHYDPQVWPDPEKFDPGRHLDKEGKFIRSFKIIPFGIGARFCLGELLARTEVFITFVKILQSFRISPATNPLPPLNDGICFLLYSPHQYQVVLSERN